MTSASAPRPSPVVLHRDLEPLAPGPGDVADRRQLQAAVDLLGLAEERRGVAHAAGHHAVGDDPDRHVAHHLVLREPAPGRLEADQAVDRGRDPDRAAAVVGVRDRYGAGRHQRRRPADERARGVVEVPRVADRAEPRVLGGGAEAVLRQLGLAERDQPGREEHPGEVAVAPGRVGRPRRRCPAGGHPGDVDVVLDEGGYAGEEAAARLAGLAAGPVERAERERVELAG